MKSLRERPYLPPFFSYVGGKRGLIECYPRPKHDVIIEPFAGSAGYACRWGAGRRVILVAKLYRAAVPCYTVLGDWCRSRRGQCVVCEDAAARWMPFEPLPVKRRKRLPPGAERIGSRNQHREGIWIAESPAARP